MKKIIMSILVLVWGLALISCKEEVEYSPPKVLTIKGYGLGSAENPNIFFHLINEFNLNNNKVKLKIDQDAENPDIYLGENNTVEYNLTKARNITEFVEKDSEWNSIFPELIESCSYNDNVYMIPFGQSIEGFCVNQDILSQYGSEDVINNFSYDNFKSVLSSLNAASNGNIMGINSYYLINWLPVVLDDNNYLKFDFWNGERIDFTYSSVIEALEEIKYFYTNKMTLDSYEEDELLNKFGYRSEKDNFEKGNIAFIKYNSLTEPDFYNLNFETKFISLPNNKVISNPYYIFISKDCMYPELAYEACKYLSFAKEGRLKMIELFEKYPELYLFYSPVIKDTDITSKLNEYMYNDAFSEVYLKMATGEINLLVNCEKYVINYNRCRHFYYIDESILGTNGFYYNFMTTDLIENVCRNVVSIESYKEVMTTVLQDEINNDIIEIYINILK